MSKEVKKPKGKVKKVPEKKPTKVAKDMEKVDVDLNKKPEVKNSPESLGFVTVPEGCQDLDFKKGIYGACKEGDKYCLDCKKEFPEAYEACKHNTELMKKNAGDKKKAIKEKSPAKPKGKKERKAVDLDCFGRKSDSGAGKCDALMLRKEGASVEEMEKFRKAVGSHIAALKKEGFNIIVKDGRYFAKAPAKK